MQSGRSPDGKDLFYPIVSLLNNPGQTKKLIMLADRVLMARTRGERALTGEDIIYELIGDALHHRREWNREAEPDFSRWIVSQIRSKVDNVVRKDSRLLPLDGFRLDDPGPGIEKAIRERLICSNDPVADLEQEEFVAGVRSLFSDDETASRVLEKVLERSSDLEIAEDLGMNMVGVQTTKRRIRRTVDRYLFELRRSTGLTAIGIALFSLICT